MSVPLKELIRNFKSELLIQSSLFQYYKILLAAHLHWLSHLVSMIRVVFTTHSNIYDGAFLQK